MDDEVGNRGVTDAWSRRRHAVGAFALEVFRRRRLEARKRMLAQNAHLRNRRVASNVVDVPFVPDFVIEVVGAGT